MASPNGSVVPVLLVLLLVAGALYLINPGMFDFMTRTTSGFAGTMGADANTMSSPSDISGNVQKTETAANPNIATIPADVQKMITSMGGAAPAAPQVAGFANMDDVAGPSEFESANGPAGCYPRDQLTPAELLPKDPNSVWAQQNPMGQGSLKGKNFLSAGALIGVNTVGQSLRNANLQLRSEPANPQVPVSVFYNSTIAPDSNRRDLEIS